MDLKIYVLAILFAALLITVKYYSNSKETFFSGGVPASFFHRFKTLLPDAPTQTPVQKKSVIAAKSDEFTLSITLWLDSIPRGTVNLCFFTDKQRDNADPVSRSPGIWLSDKHVILGLGGSKETIDLFHLNTPPKLGLNHLLFIFQENRCLFYYNGSEHQICAFKNPPRIHPNLVVGPVKQEGTGLISESAPEGRITIQYLDVDLEQDSAASLYGYCRQLITVPETEAIESQSRRKSKKLMTGDSVPPSAFKPKPPRGDSQSQSQSIDLADIDSVKMV